MNEAWAALVLLLAASYFDVAKRMVPNWLIGVFLLAAAYFHYANGTWELLPGTLASSILLAAILFKGGVWAMGDAKLFIALMLLVPRLPPFNHYAFPAVFLFILLVLTALYAALAQFRLREQRRIEELKEGDILVGAVDVAGEKIATNANGLSAEQIAKLGELHGKGMVAEKLTIRHSLPLTPFFFISLLLLFIYSSMVV